MHGADSNSYNAQAIRANSTSLFTSYGLSSAAINVFPKRGGAPTPIVESLTLNTAHFAVLQGVLGADRLRRQLPELAHRHEPD
ncbi:MAG TPA: hypothetical protein VGC79_15060, partial [Polyangiaceae bacterium]